MKVKPGKMDEFLNTMSGPEAARQPKGHLGEIVFQTDSNPNEVMLVVFFQDKETYQANANDPEMHKEYEQYRALLDADPEWNDGEVIHNSWTK
jgi:quinol monooxygenase YgiN